MSKYLGVKHVICVANGSLALQLSYKALGLKGEVITTPFSFIATASTLAWEGLKPIFADINPCMYNLDVKNIENLVTKKTSALVPVHVFGNPCEVEKIQEIAIKYNLKVIYDAAHAFGVKYKEGSVLNYGDISTLSFHATKLFHTTEGGAVITNDDDIANKVRLLINFGISSPTSIKTQGINAKMNEFEAAMGLCNLDEIESIYSKRSKIWNNYKIELNDLIEFQKWNKFSDNNFSYAPILFDSEKQLLSVNQRLNKNDIFPRRYFFPSLDSLDFLKTKNYCKKSRDIASRILCLPIYTSLSEGEQEKIINTIKSAL